MTEKPIALLLACGQLGQQVGTDLQHAGYRVIAVRRTPPQDTSLEWLPLDLAQVSVLDLLPDNIELLIYTPSPSRQQQNSYQVMYAQLAQQWVQRYQATPTLRRALLISSTRVYEERGGEWVDEDTAVQAASPETQAVIDAENSWFNGFGERACVLRLAGIYGPGREWQIRRLLARQPIQYDPPSYTNRIHQQDAAGLMTFLCVQQYLPERVFIGVDDDPVDEGTLFRWLAQQLNVAAPPARVDGVQQNKRCHNARIKSLGFELAYASFREGYPQMLARYRSQLGAL